MKKNIAIHIENVSKIYDLNQVGTGTLSKDLNRFFAKIQGKPDPYATFAEINDRTKSSKTGLIKALHEINIEIERGEVFGIIGRNGSGKSTLLKLLSQITAPTTGRIHYNGRLASLLEVGTGMHPEMTARENVFLNGAIMGMTRLEIAKKFDDIVDFAGVNKYIDTPIKRFSSGMKVRLGFAVAAFLEPEILIVDEVLAVGDAEFQKRAIGKLKDVSQGGDRTILFVSHNMASVKKLCTRGLVLKNGRLDFEGNIGLCINNYLDFHKQSEKTTYTYLSKKTNLEAYITSAKIEQKSNILYSGEPTKITVKYKAKDTKLKSDLYIGLYSYSGQKLLHLGTSYSSSTSYLFSKEGEIVCEIPKLPLKEGAYVINLSLHVNGLPCDLVKEAFTFSVTAGDYFKSGRMPPKEEGLFLLDTKWTR